LRERGASKVRITPPTILIDTREQRPFRFTRYEVQTVRQFLPSGDYSVGGLEDRIAIERKGPGDLLNCRRVLESNGAFLLDNAGRFESERLGRATFVYGEAQAPVRVGYEDQFASLRRPESLDVSNRHTAVTGVYFQGVAIPEPRLLLHDGESGVAEAVDGDDVGNETSSLIYPHVRRSETHQ
jgi:hypothetical protein